MIHISLRLLHGCCHIKISSRQTITPAFFLVYTPSFGESHAMNVRRAFHFGASLIPSIKITNNRKVYLGEPFTKCIRKPWRYENKNQDFWKSFRANFIKTNWKKGMESVQDANHTIRQSLFKMNKSYIIRQNKNFKLILKDMNCTKAGKKLTTSPNVYYFT